jgi:tRNA pseudouridine13 synthase
VTIRRQPADFIVEEIVEPAVEAAWTRERPPPAAGPAYAVYRLFKRSLTTPEATSRLAGALGVKPGMVAYAGLKDKHAQTVQHVSVAFEPGAAPVERAQNEGWRFEFVGWSTEPASAAWIASNTFEIVVRDLTRPQSDEMGRAARALVLPGPRDGASSGHRERELPSLAVINYFGDQRFGSARHGEGFAARRLIEGDFDGALKLLLASPHRKDTGAWRDFTRTAAGHWGSWKRLSKELPARPERAAVEALAAGASGAEAFARLPFFLQEMCVDAYQSHLWNACVRELVRARCGTGVIEREDDFGAMVFGAGAGARSALAGVRVPLPGPETALADVWGAPMRRALQSEGLTTDRLRIPGLRRPAFGESWREVLVEARRFDMSDPAPDDLSSRTGPARAKRGVRFALPRGAYATVVLRALGQ